MKKKVEKENQRWVLVNDTVYNLLIHENTKLWEIVLNLSKEKSMRSDLVDKH